MTSGTIVLVMKVQGAVRKGPGEGVRGDDDFVPHTRHRYGIRYSRKGDPRITQSKCYCLLTPLPHATTHIIN